MYQSKQPLYGLLMLGAKADTRLWLVLDSVPDPRRPDKGRDYLYADRNGNGDLTDVGERFEAVVHNRDEGNILEFKVGDVTGTGGAVYKGVNVVVEWRRGKEWAATISASSGGRRQDSEAVVFAARPKDAPVVHIGGPLTFELQDSPTTLERGQEKQLYVRLGTPGLGDGTFSAVNFEDVPKELHPVAEIEFAPAAKEKAGRKITVVLSQRC